MSDTDPIALANHIRQTAPSFETDSGTVYVVEKCIPVKESELIQYATSLVAPPAEKPKDRPLDLVAATINGLPMRWIPDTKLGWFLDESTFPSEHVAAINDFVNAATKDWNDVAEKNGLQICFEQSSDADSAVFDIVFERFSQPGLFAVAFFPYQDVEERHVRVGPTLFAGTDYDSVGVMRHELGHVLGFRHEHIRPEAPRRIEAWAVGEIGGEELTQEYDPKSLMHYPLAPGFGTKDFKITDMDAEGFKTLYTLSADEVEEFAP